MDTLVIGIDGGEWDVIEPMIENGKLPNIARLKESGVSGELESTTPPVSPPAWTSIQTGMNPGKHGIFDFSDFDEEYNRRSVNSADRRAYPFWEIMNDSGVGTGLFKIPLTYPPNNVDGFFVSGFPTPSTVDDFARPNSLTERVGPVDDLFEGNIHKVGGYKGYKKDLIAVAEHQTDLFIDLMSDHESEFMMTVYEGTDRIQHYFWKYFDESHPRHESDPLFDNTIEDLYETVDRGIGRILQEAEDDCDVLVISDHGFGPLTHDIQIDEWLEENGYLSRRSEASVDKTATDTVATVLRVGWQTLQRLNLENQIKSILPSGWYKFGSDLQDEHRDIIYSESEVFFSTLSGQGLFLNLEDRFKDGTVSEQERDRVISTVSDSLKSVSHPETGERLVENVYRTEDIFEGWALDDAPDLIVRTSPEYTLSGGYSDSLLETSTQGGSDRSGDHRKEGVLIASGPSFDEGTYDDGTILDIAPTLLYLHRCPIPNSMDGKVLDEILNSETLADTEPEWTDRYSRSTRKTRSWNDEEEAELEDQLKSMGYLS